MAPPSSTPGLAGVSRCTGRDPSPRRPRSRTPRSPPPPVTPTPLASQRPLRSAGRSAPSLRARAPRAPPPPGVSPPAAASARAAAACAGAVEGRRPGHAGRAQTGPVAGVHGVGSLYGPVWRPLGLRALRAVGVAALLDTDRGPRLPPQVLGGRLEGGLALPRPGQRQRQAPLRGGGRGLHGATCAPTCAPGRPGLSKLHSAQLRASRRARSPAGAPGLSGAMAPRGQTRGLCGQIAPGPGAVASCRLLVLGSQPGCALRVRRQPRLPRPVPPLPAPRPLQLSAPPPSSSVPASGGQPPEEGALPAHAEPRSRRGGGAGTQLSPERPASQRRARARRS